MKKKILKILILSILLVGCVKNENNLDINGNFQNKEDISHEFIDLSTIEPSIVLKDWVMNDNRVLYYYEYGMQYNATASKDLIEISISKKSYTGYSPDAKRENVTIKGYEVTYWFTGSIVHFIGNIDNNHIYVKSAISKPLNFEKFIEIVESVIDYTEKNL